MDELLWQSLRNKDVEQIKDELADRNKVTCSVCGAVVDSIDDCFVREGVVYHKCQTAVDGTNADEAPEKKDSEKYLQQILQYQTGTVSYSGSVDFKMCDMSPLKETKKYVEPE
jgi:hypothetical protein